jgi:hypothetical protein
LRVNTPATLADPSQYINPRSLPLFFFSPQATPAVRKPGHPIFSIVVFLYAVVSKSRNHLTELFIIVNLYDLQVDAQLRLIGKTQARKHQLGIFLEAD